MKQTVVNWRWKRMGEGGGGEGGEGGGGPKVKSWIISES